MPPPAPVTIYRITNGNAYVRGDMDAVKMDTYQLIDCQRDMLAHGFNAVDEADDIEEVQDIFEQMEEVYDSISQLSANVGTYDPVLADRMSILKYVIEHSTSCAPLMIQEQHPVHYIQ